MAERPILFNGAMVHAILSGAKTQTRRAVKGVRRDNCMVLRKQSKTKVGIVTHVLDAPGRRLCPFGLAGDRLWVRETWGIWDQGFDTSEESGFTVYRADTDRPAPKRWRPSIHMPRSECRLALEITGVRVERLQAISEDDCRAEGAAGGHGAIPGYAYSATPREHFEHVWNSTGGDWEKNPWVWAITFRKLEDITRG